MKTKTARTNASIYAVVGSDESAVKTAAAELATRLAPASRARDVAFTEILPRTMEQPRSTTAGQHTSTGSG